MTADELYDKVVIIDGCRSLKAWRTARRCRRLDKPYILAPRRQLEPWHIARCPLRRLPLLLVQHSLIRNAKAIRAVTEQERRNLLRLTVFGVANSDVAEPWNANVVAVGARSPLSYPVARQEYSLDNLLRKVVDTHPFLCMSPDETAAENRLLRVAIDSRHGNNDTMSTRDLPAVSDETLRKIRLHAIDEGVAHLIDGTAEAATIDRFAKTTKKNTSPLTRDSALTMPLHLEEVSDEEKATADDTLVCTMLLNLRFEIRRGTASKRHLTDVYELLRYTDYDEDRVARMLGRLHMQRFTRRLLAILDDALGLTEGFMPLPPLDDDGTRRLRNKLHCLQIL